MMFPRVEFETRGWESQFIYVQDRHLRDSDQCSSLWLHFSTALWFALGAKYEQIQKGRFCDQE